MVKNKKNIKKKNNDEILNTDEKLIHTIKKHINDDKLLKLNFYY